MRNRTRQARRGAFTGPARLRKVRITAHTVCDGCGHFRSSHPRGGECRHGRGQGPFQCACKGFTVVMPELPPRPARPVYTEADVAAWRADLERGLSYREVMRRHGVSEAAVRRLVPGYNGNSTHPNGTNGIRNMT